MLRSTAAVLCLAVGFAAATRCGVCDASSVDERRSREEIRESLRTRPEQIAARAYYLRGGELHLGSDFDAAIESYREALAAEPDNLDARFALARALRDSGRVSSAIREWRNCLKIKPDFVEAYAEIASTYQEEGLLDRAIWHYKKGLGIRPDDFALLTGLAVAHEAKGEEAQVLETWQRINARDPSSPEAHYRLGMDHLKNGLTNAAIAELELAIGLKPDDERYHYDLGRAFARKADDVKIIADKYSDQFRKNPKDLKARNRLALARGDVRHFLDQASRSWRRAIGIRENFPAARLALGDALAAQGKNEEAMRQYREASLSEPDNAEARFRIGSVFLKTNQYVDAIEAFEETLRLKPEYGDAWLGLASAYKAQGRSEEAIAELEEYKSRLPAVGRVARKDHRRVDRLIEDLTPKEE